MVGAGDAVGANVGLSDGTAVGLCDTVGASVVGTDVGLGDGTAVGAGVAVGASVTAPQYFL